MSEQATISLKEDDRVEVIRQVGKNGASEKVTGLVKRLSSTVTIGGEATAYVEYDDGQDGYWHPISKCKKLNQ